METINLARERLSQTGQTIVLLFPLGEKKKKKEKGETINKEKSSRILKIFVFRVACRFRANKKKRGSQI